MSYDVLVGLRDKDGEKALARSAAAYHVPGDVLICSSNEATSGTAAAVSHPLVKLMIIHCHSPRSVFCTGQVGDSNWDVVKITTPTPFKSLMMALIPASPSGMQYCF